MVTEAQFVNIITIIDDNISTTLNNIIVGSYFLPTQMALQTFVNITTNQQQYCSVVKKRGEEKFSLMVKYVVHCWIKYISNTAST